MQVLEDCHEKLEVPVNSYSVPLILEPFTATHAILAVLIVIVFSIIAGSGISEILSVLYALLIKEVSIEQTFQQIGFVTGIFD